MSSAECGRFDDNDFKAAELCCICGGGSTGGSDGGQDEGGQDEGGDSGPTCVDTDNGATDSDNWGCELGYTPYPDQIQYNPEMCGDFDDDDFIASVMCCVCGGGITS